MITRLGTVTIHVRNQEEALQFYTEKLGFVIRTNVPLGPGIRWLTVAPTTSCEVDIFLKDPQGFYDEETARRMIELTVGQAPTWVFRTDDCQSSYETLSARGVHFLSPPQTYPYGTEAVFEDLYGNKFALVQTHEA